MFPLNTMMRCVCIWVCSFFPSVNYSIYADCSVARSRALSFSLFHSPCSRFCLPLSHENRINLFNILFMPEARVVRMHRVVVRCVFFVVVPFDSLVSLVVLVSRFFPLVSLSPSISVHHTFLSYGFSIFVYYFCSPLSLLSWKFKHTHSFIQFFCRNSFSVCIDSLSLFLSFSRGKNWKHQFFFESIWWNEYNRIFHEICWKFDWIGVCPVTTERATSKQAFSLLYCWICLSVAYMEKFGWRSLELVCANNVWISTFA